MDGPFLPIEFARQTSDGRLTLVLVRNQPTVPLVRSLRALFSVSQLDVARQALADREGIQKERANVENGVWSGKTPGQRSREGLGYGLAASRSRLSCGPISQQRSEATLAASLLGTRPSITCGIYLTRSAGSRSTTSAWRRAKWTRSTGGDSRSSSAGRRSVKTALENGMRCWRGRWLREQWKEMSADESSASIRKFWH